MEMLARNENNLQNNNLSLLHLKEPLFVVPSKSDYQQTLGKTQQIKYQVEEQPTSEYNHASNKNKKTVNLSEFKIEIRIVNCREELSSNEIESIWYSPQEIDQTLKECSETVRQMNDGTPPADYEEYTSRGLEYCTPTGFDITTSSLDVVHLILEEQKRLRLEKKKIDPEMLALAMGGISRHRSRIAHLAAMKDAREVYGTQRLETTAENQNGPLSRSNSFSSTSLKRRESRRERIGRSGSFGAMEEQVRRRRGSRGSLGDTRRDSGQSIPGA